MFAKSIVFAIVIGAVTVCSICKLEGHTATTCEHPAADELRKLRSEVRQLRGGAKNPKNDRGKTEREGRKRGEVKMLAMKSYTTKPGPDKAAEERDAASKNKREAVLKDRQQSNNDDVALNALWKTGYWTEPEVCLQCKSDDISDVVWRQSIPKKQKGRMSMQKSYPHFRCSSCGHRNNCCDYSLETLSVQVQMIATVCFSY